VTRPLIGVDAVAVGSRVTGAARVLVNLLEPEPGETGLHRELPIAALLDHARERGPVAHEVFHGRSHLVLYPC